MTAVPLTVQIRPGSVADAEAIADLSGQLGYPSTAAQVRERFALMERGGAFAVSLAEVGGRVVGFVICHGVYSLQRDPCGEIGGLIVDADHRNLRIGEHLVAAAEAWARAQGFSEMIVHSNVIRADAHRFYGRLGYGIVKAQQYFRKEMIAGE